MSWCPWYFKQKDLEDVMDRLAQCLVVDKNN